MVITRVLEARGIKTTWFADQLGVSQSHISRLLSGERPWTPELRRKAAQVLMLPEDVLFLASDVQPIERNDSTDCMSQEAVK